MGFNCLTVAVLKWLYAGFTRLKDSPTLLSPTLKPLEAKRPVMVLRPYVGPTYLITNNYIIGPKQT